MKTINFTITPLKMAITFGATFILLLLLSGISAIILRPITINNTYPMIPLFLMGYMTVLSFHLYTNTELRKEIPLSKSPKIIIRIVTSISETFWFWAGTIYLTSLITSIFNLDDLSKLNGFEWVMIACINHGINKFLMPDWSKE